MPIPLGVLAVAGAGAAALPSDYDWLETTTLGSDTSSVTFSNLNNYSAYKHLQIRTVTRGASGYGGTMYLRFNGDTASNYARHFIAGFGNTVSVGGNANAAFIALPATTADGADPDSNVFGASVIDILDFSLTTKNKTIRGFGGVRRSDSAGAIELRSGVWMNTAAITSLTISPSSGNFKANSRFSLYGIK
jgi:hypothetical protein